MKNLIHKVLLLFICVLLFSCSQNEDEAIPTPANSQFFNLNVGSKWVYKIYGNSENNPTQFAFNGNVDTVKIVGVENIQGFTFAKKSSKRVNINTGIVQSTTFSYVRINSLGHLIEIADYFDIANLTETNGLVIHPINDYNYVYNREIKTTNEEVLGNIQFKLYNPENIMVEGNSYNVIPYNGIFTPSINHPELVSKTVEYSYSQNIGLIRYLCHNVGGNYAWEARLVSYQLN